MSVCSHGDRVIGSECFNMSVCRLIWLLGIRVIHCQVLTMNNFHNEIISQWHFKKTSLPLPICLYCHLGSNSNLSVTS